MIIFDCFLSPFSSFPPSGALSTPVSATQSLTPASCPRVPPRRVLGHFPVSPVVHTFLL